MTDQVPELVPVGGASRTGPLRLMALTALAVAVVTFAFGYRLGTGEGSAAIAPTPVPTASPIPTPAPTPTVIPSTSPDIMPAVVSRRLRGAVSGAGADGWAICTIDPDPKCQYVGFRLLDPAIDFTKQEWLGLTKASVGQAPLVVAAEQAGEIRSATLVNLGPDGDVTSVIGQALVPINPDRQGVYYFDVGPLAAGRYVVAVANLQGESYVAGFIVTADGAP